MAWDTERTKQLLLDAATAEFSAYGFAGARVDRIADQAGVNKERIYQYFGKKDDLFAAVLTAELTAVMDAVSLTGDGVEALVDYAGRVFDYQAEHPQLARLMFWEGLERGTPVAAEFRTERTASKVDALLTAIPKLSRDDASELLLTVLTLCDGWQALPNLDRLYTGTVERTASRNAARRRAVLTAIDATARAMLAGAR